MSKQLAEGMLYQWGKWAHDNPGLLLSTINILGRVMDEGAGSSHVDVNPEIPMPDSVATTEKVVLLLDDDVQTPLILKYVKRMSPGQASKECHCHYREYNKLIQFGIYFLAGYISA